MEKLKGEQKHIKKKKQEITMEWKNVKEEKESREKRKKGGNRKIMK